MKLFTGVEEDKKKFQWESGAVWLNNLIIAVIVLCSFNAETSWVSALVI